MSHFQDSFWVSLRSCKDIQYRAHECISAKVNLGLPSAPLVPPNYAQKTGTRTTVALSRHMSVDLQCSRFTRARFLD